jgi:transcriptional regulator with XRE-family HTH domain
MSPPDLVAWELYMGYTQRQAAEALGVSLPTYQQFRRGARFRDDTPIEIDRRTALACAALAAGITEWSPKITLAHDCLK